MPPNAPAVLIADKRALRAAILSRRAGMSDVEREAASSRAASALTEAVGTAPGVVTLFMSIGDEIATAPAIERLHRRGVRLALPVMTGKGQRLLFRHYTPGDRLAPGTWDIPEPLPAAPEAVPDTIVLPLVAFDRHGGRLGYGAGFYDRTLSHWRALRPVRAIGFAFACQEAVAVPREAHDEPLDAVVTENGVVTLGPPR